MGMGNVVRQVRAKPLVADALLAAALAVVTVVYARQSYQVRYQDEGWPAFDVWATGLSLLANLPLALRRKVPWPVLLTSCGAVLVYTAAGYQPSVNLWAPLLACYTVIARRPARAPAVAAAVTVGVWLFSGLGAHLSVELAVAQTVIGVGIVWIFAAAMRRLAERNVQLAEMTERLRREQALRAQHAVVEERVRIARELHDVVAHHLSALAVQANLASYVFSSDPDTARAALTSIGATSREALEEMRGLLEVLRVPPETDSHPTTDAQPGRSGGASPGRAATDPSAGTDPTSPQEDGLYLSTPGLDQLERLVQRTRLAGIDVEVYVTGTARPLPPGADLCAFRVIQEALTNVLKHAGSSSSVTIALAYDTDCLSGQVLDDGGRGQTAAARRTGLPGSGLGLIGMRERVRLYGGSLRAGPRPDGGFEVAFSIRVPAARP